MKKTFLWLAALVFLLGLAGFGYYRYTFPYGRTHRCSKIFAGLLSMHADAHEGHFPSASSADRLGLTKIMAAGEDSSGPLFAMIVGKAGDLEKAREFYDKNGYLKPEHSSWHYVSGLGRADVGRALAWDKIPLSHNGMRMESNPREVIMTNGMVNVVREADWPAFLAEQKKLTEEKKSARKRKNKKAKHRADGEATLGSFSLRVRDHSRKAG